MLCPYSTQQQQAAHSSTQDAHSSTQHADRQLTAAYNSTVNITHLAALSLSCSFQYLIRHPATFPSAWDTRVCIDIQRNTSIGSRSLARVYVYLERRFGGRGGGGRSEDSDDCSTRTAMTIAQSSTEQLKAAHSSSQQHTAAHSSSQQHIAADRQLTAAHSGTQQLTVAHSSSQQHTAAHSSTQQLTTAHSMPTYLPNRPCHYLLVPAHMTRLDPVCARDSFGALQHALTRGRARILRGWQLC